MIEKLKHVWDFVYKDGENEEWPVVIVGPSGTKGEEEMLRMYAYGGRIGTIPMGTGKYGLLDRKYKNHLSNPQDAEKLEKMFQEEDKKGLIFSEAYLELAVKATKAKFTKAKSKPGGKSLKERNIQTQIVKQYMAEGTGWRVIDMEFRVPKQEEMEKHSQVDIVVFDEEKGFGLIELKYNNENCDNLDEHCNDYNKICSDRKISEKNEAELIRRAEYLANYKLIDSRYYEKMMEIKNSGSAIGFWYGFLFVGGGKNRSADLVKRMGKAADEEACRFLYVENIDDAIDLRYGKMESYAEFINE